MMSMRESFYYLGFIGQGVFAFRFMQQWIDSELKGKSSLSPFYWYISLLGNALLLVHASIQIQYHVGFIQICNSAIALRNLQWMQKKQPSKLSKWTLYLLFFLLIYTIFFLVQGLYFSDNGHIFFRIPASPYQNYITTPHYLWHIIGFLGYSLFSIRFFVQLWNTEKLGISTLPKSFWWMSIIGKCISIIYFIRIADPVNLFSPLFAIIPYIRNLYFLKRKEGS